MRIEVFRLSFSPSICTIASIVIGDKIVENRVMQQYVKLNKAGRKKILDMMGDFSQLDKYQAD